MLAEGDSVRWELPDAAVPSGTAGQIDASYEYLPQKAAEADEALGSRSALTAGTRAAGQCR